MTAFLTPYRIIDCTDHRGQLAGMILGDLGADVIRVEPPGGSPARFRGPQLSGVPATEASLEFFAFNRNKRSIVLDPSDAADREQLEKLLGPPEEKQKSQPPKEQPAAEAEKKPQQESKQQEKAEKKE